MMVLFEKPLRFKTIFQKLSFIKTVLKGKMFQKCRLCTGRLCINITPPPSSDQCWLRIGGHVNCTQQQQRHHFYTGHNIRSFSIYICTIHKRDTNPHCDAAIYMYSIISFCFNLQDDFLTITRDGCFKKVLFVIFQQYVRVHTTRVRIGSDSFNSSGLVFRNFILCQ